MSLFTKFPSFEQFKSYYSSLSNDLAKAELLLDLQGEVEQNATEMCEFLIEQIQNWALLGADLDPEKILFVNAMLLSYYAPEERISLVQEMYRTCAKEVADHLREQPDSVPRLNSFRRKVFVKSAVAGEEFMNSNPFAAELMGIVQEECTQDDLLAELPDDIVVSEYIAFCSAETAKRVLDSLVKIFTDDGAISSVPYTIDNTELIEIAEWYEAEFQMLKRCGIIDQAIERRSALKALVDKGHADGEYTLFLYSLQAKLEQFGMESSYESLRAFLESGRGTLKFAKHCQSKDVGFVFHALKSNGYFQPHSQKALFDFEAKCVRTWEQVYNCVRRYLSDKDYQPPQAVAEMLRLIQSTRAYATEPV